MVEMGENGDFMDIDWRLSSSNAPRKSEMDTFLAGIKIKIRKTKNDNISKCLSLILDRSKTKSTI